MIFRPATRDDLAAVVALLARSDERYRGYVDSDESDLLDDWDSPGWDMEAGTLVLEDEGAVIGYATVSDDFADTVLDPDRYDEALAARLLGWVEAHPVHLEHYAPDTHPELNALLERRGWVATRRFWRLWRELDGAGAPGLPEPQWPDGVRVREYSRPDDDVAVHALITASFREIGGQTERTLERWRQFLLDTDRFDPSLYLVAVEASGEVVGASLSQDVETYGFVRQLAVAPSQRGRGLGIALLHESFRRHAARRLPATSLGVDAGNPTGALRLYQKAGMRVREQFTRWDRPAPA